MTTTLRGTDVLVTTDWVDARLDSGLKLIEIDVDTTAYAAGHIPGAFGLNWQALQDPVRRDILSNDAFETLMRAMGIREDDTVVVYGDNHNGFAAYGFWLFELHGHPDVRLMDGGRAKWLAEDDKELTVDIPVARASDYVVAPVNASIRALLPDVLAASDAGTSLIDVRSPDEFSGRVIAPPGLSETAQRGGHIPAAVNVPWAMAVAGDGTFKSRDELRRLYLDGAGLDRNRPAIAYCRTGERSSHTWFALRHIVGLDDVRNYDGSWTEYGNLVGAPIEKRGAP